MNEFIEIPPSLNVSAIISEYNPFHLGHKYQIEKTRELGSTHIIAVMSGNFVQRGEPAIMSKWARAKSALFSGVDLVIELPAAFSMAGAEKFAEGAVSIAHNLGCVNNLVFGAEQEDIKKLDQIASLIFSNDFKLRIKQEISKGNTFAKARQQVISNLTNPETALVLETPNNILAIEYIKALKKLNSNIKPIAIKRMGTQHDSNESAGNFASASLIRKMILESNSLIHNFMPSSSLETLKEEIQNLSAPSNIKYAERAILSKWRSITRDEIALLPDISEGLENRIYQAIKQSTTIDELYKAIKTKRYTLARIRRIILSAFLGIQKSDSKVLPLYIRVLGMNDRGKEILHLAKKTASLPIITKTSKINLLSDQAKNMFNLEIQASDLYSMFLPQLDKSNLDLIKSPIVI